MTFEELQTAISHDQVATANDIDDYLMDASTPTECHQRDISVTLAASRERVQQLLIDYAEENSKRQEAGVHQS